MFLNLFSIYFWQFWRIQSRRYYLMNFYFLRRNRVIKDLSIYDKDEWIEFEEIMANIGIWEKNERESYKKKSIRKLNIKHGGYDYFIAENEIGEHILLRNKIIKEFKDD